MAKMTKAQEKRYTKLYNEYREMGYSPKNAHEFAIDVLLEEMIS